MKQSPRPLYHHIKSYFVKLGFIGGNSDLNLYFNVVQGMSLILVLYVDNLFLISIELVKIKHKRDLFSKLEMKDLRLIHYFLGLEAWERTHDIFL